MSEKEIKRIVKADDKHFILPVDIRRKRIFWALSAFFVILLCVVAFLLILLLDVARPPGFGGGTISPVANFRVSHYGANNLLFSRPTAIALSSNGEEIYLADTNNRRIVVLDRSGNFVRSITEITSATAREVNEADGLSMQEDDPSLPSVPLGDYASPLDFVPEAFVAPTALAFARDGRWFVIDQSLRMVMFFDANDHLMRGMVLEEEAPINVDVNMVGDYEQLFITTRSGILRASLEGEFNFAYLNWGLLSGQLDNPAAVVVFDPAHMAEEASISTTDTATLTIVADTLNNRVQAFRNFDTAPEVAWMFGQPILAPDVAEEVDYVFENMIIGNMTSPVDLAISPLGRLFVVDALSSEIVVLNAQTGAYLYTISSVGSRDGLLYYPAGVDFSDGDLYVVDRFNDRVSVFEDAPSQPAVESADMTPAEPLNRWFLLLVPVVALLLTIFRLLSLRMPRYIFDLSSLESLGNDDDLLRFIIEHYDRIDIVSGTETVAEKMLPGYFWKIGTVKESKRDDLIDKHPGLNDVEAEAIILAGNKRRRLSYLVTTSRVVERAAEDAKVKVLKYADFRNLAHMIISDDRAVQEAEDARNAAKIKKKAEKATKKEDKATKKKGSEPKA